MVITRGMSILWVAVLALMPSPQHAETVEEKLQRIDNSVGILTKQFIQDKLAREENVRSSGSSGIKSIRNKGKMGNNIYQSTTTVDDTVNAIHDHPDNDKTVGLAESVFALNGLQFTTRHNDYKIVMKSTTSTELDATETVDRPEVPETVLNQATIQGEIDEMTKWLEAFADNNITERDYRPYFKPVLCYLEGFWTNSQNGIGEPFESDRHFLDANDREQLFDKFKFSAESGEKDPMENLAHLPTVVCDIVNDTLPVLCQWNYRILCHPVSQDIPLSRFRAIDDFKTQAAFGMTKKEYTESRAAMFDLTLDNNDIWDDEFTTGHTFMDKLMQEVPGTDGYMGKIISTDKFDCENRQPQDVSRYSRCFRTDKGQQTIAFNDDVYVAETTNSNVYPSKKLVCIDGSCVTELKRYTYAIPIEFLFLTPLFNWNPYKLFDHGKKGSSTGNVPFKGPDGTWFRNGELTAEKAYNGTNNVVFYRTPTELFAEDALVKASGADTSLPAAGVLDRNGIVRNVTASGMRTFLPTLRSTSTSTPQYIRLRFPVVRRYEEGSVSFAELEAIKAMVKNPSKFRHMYEAEIPAMTVNNRAEPANQTLTFRLMPSDSAHGNHTHILSLDHSQTAAYLNGDKVDLYTSVSMGHNHWLNIQNLTNNNGVPVDTARRCNEKTILFCPDGHPRALEVMTP